MEIKNIDDVISALKKHQLCWRNAGEEEPDEFLCALYNGEANGLNLAIAYCEELKANMEADDGWDIIENSPKTIPTFESLSFNDPSEWFHGYGKKIGQAIIRRVDRIGDYKFEGTGGEYYKEELFTHYRLLPSPPKGEK